MPHLAFVVCGVPIIKWGLLCFLSWKVDWVGPLGLGGNHLCILQKVKKWVSKSHFDYNQSFLNIFYKIHKLK
jgi:hypothetical protein